MQGFFMDIETAQNLVEEATLSFTLGDAKAALESLNEVIENRKNFFPAWHAKCEILYSMGDFHEALIAALEGHQLEPEDVHINTSLSRIYMRIGEKKTAEKYGAEARRLGWRETLKGDTEQSQETV
jgi:tetratricopeptide (TPR) repeat protein